MLGPRGTARDESRVCRPMGEPSTDLRWRVLLVTVFDAGNTMSR
jgi:hypothetical protein